MTSSSRALSMQAVSDCPGPISGTIFARSAPNRSDVIARRQAMTSDLLGADLAKMVPLIGPGQSDTACIDNALELLVIGGGYSLAHAMMMLIPEAWAGNPLMDAQR